MDQPGFDKRDGFIWFDGALVAWEDAHLHVLSHGLHYASCVFEGERAYGGEVFHLRDHCLRLLRSAELLGFEIPYDVGSLENATRDILRAQNLRDAYVRPVAWRGSEMMGVSAQKTRIHLSIAAWEWPSYFSSANKGIRLDISDWRRPDPRTAPCHSKAAGLYMICTLAKHAAEAKGYEDALMLDWRGFVAEATGANIFFVREGVLHTPIADCFLSGITRRTAIEIAHSHKIEVIERIIKPEELEDFEECFITGTAAEITAVREIGPYHFSVGEITRQLQSDYAIVTRPHSAAAE